MAYSKKEKLIADLLSKMPFVKRWVKFSYQWLNSLMNKKGYKFKCKHDLVPIGSAGNESFFGYYDKSPLSPNGDYIIYHESSRDTQKKPSKSEGIDVVLFSVKENKEVKRFNTFTYNWQQGAKLMWVDDSSFIYNDFNSDKKCFVAKLVKVNQECKSIEVDYPIYDVHGDVGLTLSFKRLNKIMPDYGYRSLNGSGEFHYGEEGITKIDLKNKTSHLLLSIDKVINLHKSPSMVNAEHWFNHIMISPNGEHFIFLHRWIKGGVKNDALIVSDINGKHVKCLADDGMVSHCCWDGNNTVLAFMRTKEIGDKYYSIDIKSGRIDPFGESLIDKFGDGHPSSHGDMVIFDTYPDRGRMKHLYRFNKTKNELEELGEFHESLKFYGETRCDLHPKVSYDGTKVFIDSVHEGKRRLYMLNLSENA